MQVFLPGHWCLHIQRLSFVHTIKYRRYLIWKSDLKWFSCVTVWRLCTCRVYRSLNLYSRVILFVFSLTCSPNHEIDLFFVQYTCCRSPTESFGSLSPNWLSSTILFYSIHHNYSIHVHHYELHLLYLPLHVLE